jgi:hypothetical protein
MRELSWAETVRRVHQRAEHRGEYCQTAQRVMGQAMHVEHIHPDGPDAPEEETVEVSYREAAWAFDYMGLCDTICSCRWSLSLS